MIVVAQRLDLLQKRALNPVTDKTKTNKRSNHYKYKENARCTWRAEIKGSRNTTTLTYGNITSLSWDQKKIGVVEMKLSLARDPDKVIQENEPISDWYTIALTLYLVSVIIWTRSFYNDIIGNAVINTKPS